jgi:hypothetical protein
MESKLQEKKALSLEDYVAAVLRLRVNLVESLLVVDHAVRVENRVHVVVPVNVHVAVSHPTHLSVMMTKSQV